MMALGWVLGSFGCFVFVLYLTFLQTLYETDCVVVGRGAQEDADDIISPTVRRVDSLLLSVE